MSEQIDEPKWIEVSKQLPPVGKVVETKIEDEDGVRNVQKLQRHCNLYFIPNTDLYVYYTPTHWRLKL